MKLNKIYPIIALILCFSATIEAQNEKAESINKRRNDLYISNLTSVNSFYDPALAAKSKNGVLQDNELECSGSKTMLMATYDYNPLKLNGLPLDYDNFYLGTRGVLSVADDKTKKEIPFYVSIRRDGKIINETDMPFADKVLYKIELSEIFKYCKPNDRLIIKPANHEDLTLKRILRLIEGC